MNDFKDCPYCAEKIRAMAKICRFCGEQQPQNTYIPNPAPVQPMVQQPQMKAPSMLANRKARIIIAAVIGFFILLLIGGGAFYFFKKKSAMGQCGANNILNTAQKVIKNSTKDRSAIIAKNRGVADKWQDSSIEHILSKMTFKIDDIKLLANNIEENKLYCTANVKVSVPSDLWSEYTDSLNAQASAKGKNLNLDPKSAPKHLADQLRAKIDDGTIIFEEPIRYSVESNNVIVNVQNKRAQDAMAVIATDIAMKSEFVAQSLNHM